MNSSENFCKKKIKLIFSLGVPPDAHRKTIVGVAHNTVLK